MFLCTIFSLPLHGHKLLFMSLLHPAAHKLTGHCQSQAVPREPLETGVSELSLGAVTARPGSPQQLPRHSSPAQPAPNTPLQLPTHAAALRGHCRGARVWNQLLGYLQEKSNRKSALSVLRSFYSHNQQNFELCEQFRLE